MRLAHSTQRLLLLSLLFSATMPASKRKTAGRVRGVGRKKRAALVDSDSDTKYDEDMTDALAAEPMLFSSDIAVAK